MEAYVIVGAAALIVLIWIVWMSWEGKRSDKRFAQSIADALAQRGASDINVTCLTDTGSGIGTYEATYTDVSGERFRVACLMSSGYLFWSDARPLRAGLLLKEG
jgi:hypothetical protein